MRIAICGLKKTGTTGLFRTIRSSMTQSGAEPVCAFEPRRPKVWKAFSRRAKASVSFLSKVIFKDHFLTEEHLALFDHRVMIVRDPRDRLISAMLFRGLSHPQKAASYISALVELVQRKEAAPRSMSVRAMSEAIDELAGAKMSLTAHFAQFEVQVEAVLKRGFHVIRYEDFVEGELSSLSEKLALDLMPAERDQPKWLSHIVRTKRYGDWRQWFTPEDVDAFRPMLEAPMRTLGYDVDWEVDDAPTIDPSAASGYLRRNFEERLAQVKDASLIGEAPSEAALAVAEARARDGRPGDCLRVGRWYLDRDERRAFDLFELGHLLGHRGCDAELRAMIHGGFRPETLRSKVVERWIPKNVMQRARNLAGTLRSTVVQRWIRRANQ